MAKKNAKQGKLAYKFLFWFLLISLLPLVFTGYRLIHLTQLSLKQETLRGQTSRAVGFSEMVYSYVTNFRNILLDTAQIREFASMDNSTQRGILNRLMHLHPAYLELSVINMQGEEVIRLGRLLGKLPEKRNFNDSIVYLRTLREGEMIGALTRFLGAYPALNVAVLIRDPDSKDVARGVLLGKITLNGLSQMLHDQFPEPETTQAVVIGPGGFLVAHSDLKKAFSAEVSLPKEILDIIQSQSSETGGGEIAISSGERLLGAFATVKDLGWQVYVQKPIAVAYQAVNQIEGQIYRVLLIVIVVTILLSLVVAGRISQPIRNLKEAAVKLSQGEFDRMPESPTSNDEIGDLTQTFIDMSDSLKDKTGQLVTAKEELQKLNRTLEHRVEARTRELRAAQEELIAKERLAAIGGMASVVGHEIRNPLAVINNSTYFIKAKLSAGEVKVDPKINKHLAIIESEIQQANGIISEILTFARQRELKLEPHRINQFMEEILSSYPIPGNIQVLKEYSDQEVTVNIDADEMKQVLRNLIGNAIEVMPGGGVIKFDTRQINDWLCIGVADSGSGIPKDVLEKIFTPFFTTKARGTGLGLAVVKKVIDHHRGKVEVKSAVGKGTVFHLYLPIASRLSPTAELKPTEK
ncbi:MAG: HAMP domain-containing protein [Elusimicrobia bacterium]|nr:HAMP domain-containing protein [Elusimicrobiota bacterium]